MNEAQSEYERWMRPIEERLMRTVWRIVRDPDDAEDAFQQALEKIWRQWGQVRRHPNPPALIMTIGANAAYDHLRKRSRRAAHEIPDLEMDRHLSHAPGADRRLEGEQTRSMIHDAIGELPMMQRSTITLRLFAELSYGEIARALGCSEVTARTHFMRALQRLRSQLAPLNPLAREEAKS